MNRDPLQTEYEWAVRVHLVGERTARAYARNHALTIGQQASVAPSDEHPSAIELLLGALGSDVIVGVAAQARRRGVTLDGVELALRGKLDNVLVHLGVIGETGHPGLSAVTGTLYVSADADEPALVDIWEQALARSPVYQTLSRCARIDIRLRTS
jgi:uncharacterized OsmC-like protein